jgi:hypothetical protein
LSEGVEPLRLEDQSKALLEVRRSGEATRFADDEPAKSGGGRVVE